MRDELMLLGALVSSVAGMGWLALAMDVHWEQVRGKTPRSPALTRGLRVLGGLALLVSLVLCLAVDHATMASLVWVMAIAVAALIIALALAWRARWLAPLVFWTDARGEGTTR
jgi:uncharacterized membrane protein